MTSKGQLLIPKHIRSKYGFKSGIKVALEETDKGILIRPMNRQYFESFAGIVKSTGNFQEEMKEFKEEEKSLEERKFNLIFGKSKGKSK